VSYGGVDSGVALDVAWLGEKAGDRVRQLAADVARTSVQGLELLAVA
jgi:hypothetical protein